MARKVFITSDMSIDDGLGLIAETDPLSALLWPWFLTVFDDWGRAEANVRKLKPKVFPTNDAVTHEAIERALIQYSDKGLIQLYEVGGKRYMAIPSGKWFKYQTHIRREKRLKDDSRLPAPPQLREDARECAQLREDASKCIPSPSPSPSLSPSDVPRSSAANTLHSTTNTPGGDGAAADELKNDAWDEVQARYAELTGRIYPSPLDVEAINEALRLTGGRADLVITVMETVARHFKGDKINSFSYFIPRLRDTVAYLKARASPGAVLTRKPRSGTIMSEIMSGLPPDLRGDVNGEPEDDLNRFIIRDTG